MALAIGFIIIVVIYLAMYAFKTAFLNAGILLSMLMFRFLFQNWNVLIMESYLTIYRGLASGYFYGI